MADPPSEMEKMKQLSRGKMTCWVGGKGGLWTHVVHKHMGCPRICKDFPTHGLLQDEHTACNFAWVFDSIWLTIRCEDVHLAILIEIDNLDIKLLSLVCRDGSNTAAWRDQDHPHRSKLGLSECHTTQSWTQ